MAKELHITKPKLDLNYASDKKPVTSEGQLEAKPLPKITIDGKTYEFKPGDTIMQVAERYQVHEEIPRYCYHPGLPIAGTCRMCTVEVEKSPKLMTSCSTPAADGMIVHTRSEKVLQSRTGVMEFLLTNHPLDCPVCDKAGECKLQDFNYEYGPGTSNFKEEKRVFHEATTKKLSDKVTLNMNRCVHCERCVRFTEDVTKTYDLIMVNRGWHKELTAATDAGLTNDYQGCLTDFCPVGALTWNDFRFKKRSWFLSKSASVCDNCSKGCNIEVHSESDVVYRYIPIYNEQVNGHWMCDVGRNSYHTYMDPQRIITPMEKKQDSMVSTNLQNLLAQVIPQLKKAQSIQIIIGTDATREEAQLLKESLPGLLGPNVSVVSYNGTGGVVKSSDDQKVDQVLKMKDLTPNTRGLEEVGITPLSASGPNAEIVILFRNGRAGTPVLGENQKVLLWGVWNQHDVKLLPTRHILGVIAGLATIEKAGSFTNTDGITQNFQPAIVHRGGALSVPQVVNIWKTLI